MTTEEKLIDLHARYEEREKKWLREKRITAVMFFVLAITGLIALIYGFSQQADAMEARFGAEETRIVAERQMAELKKQLVIEMEKSATCEKKLSGVGK